jgi:hypothetical protein
MQLISVEGTKCGDGATVQGCRSFGSRVVSERDEQRRVSMQERLHGRNRNGPCAKASARQPTSMDRGQVKGN